MIVRLIASGVLLEGGYLFWDEPEANLNPSSQKAVAHALKHLADQGSQIFVATHSMFLLRELQMSGGSADTRYIGLERRRSDAQGAAAARWLHNQATISMTSSLLPHSRPRLSNLTDTWLGESRVTSKELLVDGTFFTFPPNWQTEIFDEWPQYKRATGELELRGCDVLALDGQDLWIIEMKDYTYDGASSRKISIKRWARRRLVQWHYSSLSQELPQTARPRNLQSNARRALAFTSPCT